MHIRIGYIHMYTQEELQDVIRKLLQLDIYICKCIHKLI